MIPAVPVPADSDRIRELKRRSHGEYTIVLHDGTRVKSSRGYTDRLEELLES